jgi:hypothetical protein
VVSNHCFGWNWIRINQAIGQALRGVTLADMVKPNLPVLIPLRRLTHAAQG